MAASTFPYKIQLYMQYSQCDYSARSYGTFKTLEIRKENDKVCHAYKRLFFYPLQLDLFFNQSF